MLIDLNEAKDFLGESGSANDALISALIASSEEEITRATGVDWSGETKNSAAKELCFLMVWRGFVLSRGEATNTEFIERRIVSLTTQLQYGVR